VKKNRFRTFIVEINFFLRVNVVTRSLSGYPDYYRTAIILYVSICQLHVHWQSICPIIVMIGTNTPRNLKPLFFNEFCIFSASTSSRVLINRKWMRVEDASIHPPITGPPITGPGPSDRFRYPNGFKYFSVGACSYVS